MKKLSIYAASALVVTSVSLFGAAGPTNLNNPVTITTNTDDFLGHLRINTYDDNNDKPWEWQIEADTTSGWHYFNIDSVYGGKIIGIGLSEDTSAADAKNSLIINSNGDINLADGSVWIDRSVNKVGIGTTTPRENIDIVDTTTFGTILYTYGSAKVRTEAYNNSKWSMGADYYRGPEIGGVFYRHNSFKITDLNTSATPFKIWQGSDTGLLTLTSNTVSTNGNLYVDDDITSHGIINASWSGTNDERDGLKTMLTLKATNDSTTKGSSAGFSLVDGKANLQWDFRTSQDGTAFLATRNDTVGSELRVLNKTTGTDLAQTKVFFGGVKVFENGHLVTASSRELKTNIKSLDTQAALDAFHKLQPVSYEYKAQKGEPVVGFIAEDIPDLVAMPTRTALDSTEIVAVLTKVVQEQDKVLTQTRSELKVAQEKIAKLEKMQKRLARVESLLTNLALNTPKSKTEKVSLNK